ncbi:hypothetical protein BMW24_022035 [Mycobacterium heckeshornense]|nr:hypothetical protein BMW24_022035 [Mycobacterium heckeshornense]
MAATMCRDLSTRRRRPQWPPNSGPKVSPTVRLDRFASRAVRQYVDWAIEDYSPSMTISG